MKPMKNVSKMETIKSITEIEYLIGSTIKREVEHWYGEAPKVTYTTTLKDLFTAVKNELIQFEQKYYGSNGIGTKEDAGFIWGDIFYFYADGKLLFTHKCDFNFCRSMGDKRILEYIRN